MTTTRATEVQTKQTSAQPQPTSAKRTNGELVDLITAPLTSAQVAWCVEQARNCDIDRDDELTDRQVLATYVRRYGADELRNAAADARHDCPVASGPAAVGD